MKTFGIQPSAAARALYVVFFKAWPASAALPCFFFPSLLGAVFMSVEFMALPVKFRLDLSSF